MMTASCCRAMGLAVLTVLTCPRAFGDARPSGLAIEDLPVWAAKQLKARGDQSELRIALIGFNPDINDPRLHPKGSSRVLIAEANAKLSRADTEMVAWLTSACPRTPSLILVAPIVANARPQRTMAVSGK